MSDAPEGSPVEKIRCQAIESQIVEVIRTIYDPEIPVNIYEMGLIYDVAVGPEGKVHVKMTLTSPACPVAGALVAEVESKTRAIDGVTDVVVELVWDPPWTPEKMSEAAKVELNMF
ncbi:MAG: DUF59 domain-containing protein [Phycisphaerae bacterium]